LGLLRTFRAKHHVERHSALRLSADRVNRPSRSFFRGGQSMFRLSADLAFALTGFAAFVSAPLPDSQNSPRDTADLRSMLPLFLLLFGMLIISSTAAVMFPSVFGEVLEQF
jgi:hypothetical protein